MNFKTWDYVFLKQAKRLDVQHFEFQENWETPAWSFVLTITECSRVKI